VVRRSSVEAPLSAVRSIVLHQSARERLFGLGSLGFATAAMDGVEVVWRMVDRPHEVRERARGEIRASGAGRPAAEAEPARGQARDAEGHMPIIGVAGGIGSGKSELARALGRLGCVVVDSDAEAKAALDLPEVREELLAWCGKRILNEEGRIDRHALAAIVFEDDEARRRLERLVHPIVKTRRAEQAAAARARGAAGFVIDAPLLFEAGVDAECDYIVFVDAPRELRLERVKARGWGEAELDRRERSQWSLERKRAASDEIIKNAGPLTDLEGAAQRILKSAASRTGGRGITKGA
jgi:dephospho-CoA kinase